jgi:hypothetical protein
MVLAFNESDRAKIENLFGSIIEYKRLHYKYNLQAETNENKSTAIPLALDGGLRSTKVVVCVILSL